MRSGTRERRQYHHHHHRQRHNHPHQVGETWTLKPIQDQTREDGDKNQLQEREEQNSNFDFQSTSQTPIMEPTSISSPKSSKYHRNPKWVSRNRHNNAVNPRFVKKSELESSSSELVSLNDEVGSLSLNEEVNGNQEVKENEEDDSSLKNEVGGEKIEGHESGDGVSKVVRVLQELWLGTEDPELSEEQLAINDQLQEDEVNSAKLDSLLGL